MKRISLISVIPFRRWTLFRHLKFQTGLLKKGVGFRTSVQRVLGESLTNSGYKKIDFEAVVRHHGRSICKKLYTLARVDENLHAGERVLIRYRLGKTTLVTIRKTAA